MPQVDPFPLPFPGSEDQQVGRQADLFVLRKGEWLQQTEVAFRLSKRRNRWQVYLLFIWVQDPFQISVKYIAQYPTKEKAIIHAQLFQRSARRGSRGTLQTNQDAFFICLN
jgi:hypothetical protein